MFTASTFAIHNQTLRLARYMQEVPEIDFGNIP